MDHIPSPAVTMLWEGVSPDVALLDRFGFDDPAAAGCWVVNALREQWAVEADVCERIVISGGNALATP